MVVWPRHKNKVWPAGFRAMDTMGCIFHEALFLKPIHECKEGPEHGVFFLRAVNFPILEERIFSSNQTMHTVLRKLMITRLLFAGFAVFPAPAQRPADHLPNQLSRAFSERIFKNCVHETLRDGMDQALYRNHPQNWKPEYSRAYNPLKIARGGEMIIQKPDKLSVGSFHAFPDRTYTKHAFDLRQGNMFYLFSAGYADPFGGPKSKKLEHKNLKDLLLNHSHKNAREQEAILDHTFTQQIGKEEQVDDIVIIGIRAI